MFLLLGLVTCLEQPKKTLKETMLKLNDKPDLMTIPQVEEFMASTKETMIRIQPPTNLLTSVKMSLAPTNTDIYAIGFLYLEGTISIDRNFIGTITADNTSSGLLFKIKTPPKAAKPPLSYVKALFPPIFYNGGDISVSLQYTDLKGVKEADAVLFFVNSELKKLSADCGKYTCTYKTKKANYNDYFGDDNLAMLKEDSNQLMLGYYEVSSGLSPGAIAGIAVACVVVVAGIGIGTFFIIKHKKAKIIT